MVVQPPIPSFVCVEHRREAFQADDAEGVAEARVVECARRVRIFEPHAQRHRRHIARRRHEDDRLAMRPRDAAAAPGPKPRDRLEQGAFGVLFAGDENVIAWLHLQVGLAQGEAPGGRREPQLVEDDQFFVPPVHSIRLSPSPSLSSVNSVLRKLATRCSVARQSAMPEKLLTYHPNACCTWLNAPTTIINLPKVMPP